MIKYKKGYGYQLHETYTQTIPILGRSADLQFIKLTPGGVLTIRKGYSWDGASGPAIDTKTFMRASLVHDACYELIRYGALTRKDKEAVDQLMRDVCLDAGMVKPRAWWVWKGVDWFGGRATRRGRKVLTAP